MTYGCFAAGSGVDSAPCTSAADCAPGHTCLSYGTKKFCKKYCTVDSDCASNGLRCMGEITACTGNLSGRYCEKSCTDPATTTSGGCQTGFKCTTECSGSVANVSCNPAGTQTAGTCTSTADCAAQYDCLGLTTADGGIAYSCLQYCTTTGVVCKVGSCSLSRMCGGIATGHRLCQTTDGIETAVWQSPSKARSESVPVEQARF
jgi:hypothetical protein